MHLKYIVFAFLLSMLGLRPSLMAQVTDAHIWVNEFHYDEVTSHGETDENEFIELVVSNQILDNPVEAAKLKLVLYTAGGVGLDDDPNFAKGLPYHESSILYSEAITVHSIAENNADGSGGLFQRCTPEGANYSLLSKDLESLQDVTAGFAIIYDNELLVQFISYEGTFKACVCPEAGAAAGMTTTLIDATPETTSSFDDHSIQLLGTASAYGDFNWNGAMFNTESKCEVNAGQVINDLSCIAPVIDDPGTLTTSCVETFTLPSITGSFLSGNEAYYDNTQASGIANIITEVSESTTVYIFDDAGASCSDEVTVNVVFEGGIEIDPITEGTTACDVLTLPAIMGTAVTANAAYFTMPNGMGDRFEVGDDITASADLYAYEVSGGCSDEELVSFTVNATPVLEDIPNGTFCDAFELPSLAAGAYFTESGGNGTALAAGSLIEETGTYYIYADNNGCTAEESFMINITDSPVIAEIGDQQGCESFDLPSIDGTNLSGTTIKAYYTASGGTGTRIPEGTTILETTTLFRYDAVGDCFDEEEITITILDAPGLSASVTDQSSCEGTPNGSITVTPSGGTTASGNYTFEWNTGAFSKGPTGTLSDLEAGDYTVSVTDDNDCEEVQMYSVNCTALALDLLSFSAKLIDGDLAVLQWMTANESLFSHFEILRSDHDNKEWTNLGKVAAGTGRYEFSDKDLAAQFKDGTLLYYQLKMVNQDGSFEFSSIRTLLLSSKIGAMEAFPNPSSGKVTVLFSTTQTHATQLRILSVTGELIKQFTIKEPAVANRQELDLSTLAKGIYFLEMRLGGETQRQRIVLE